MINLMVSPDDEIVIKFIVAVDNDGKIYADHDKQMLVEILGKIEYKLEEHSVVFKKPSFKDLLNMNESFYGTGDGKISFNPMADRHHKMTKLIKSWSLKDAEGKMIAPTSENIGNLSPAVADIIAVQLELEIG